MPQMSSDELRALLAAEYSLALGSMQASELVAERADAMDYYLGHMAKDMPAADGRSQAVSFDVADTIEGLMPPIMEIFAGSEEVVQFDPVGPNDVEAAQQETDYVNHVFMNQNPGFLVLYSFIKDALLSKVGIVKVFWEQREQEEQETYQDLDDNAYALVVSDPDVEVVEHTVKPLEAYGQPYTPEQERAEQQLVGQPTLHDVKVVKRKDYSCAKVVPVPPEEFGIERGARSLRDCNYCYHKVISSESKLVEQGYDAQQVKQLPSYRAYTNIEEISRDTVAENQLYGDELNKAARLVEIIEHYVRMDYDKSGKARLYKVTTNGINGEIMRLDGKEDIEEFDAIPFAAMTPVIMTHRFWGRSIADLVMDIQRIKTALLRGTLDNVYLALNPRVEVAESMASDNTLDDLLVSRPGGIVRTKQPGGLNWQEVPNVVPGIAPMFEYMDTLREWRTGVSRQGQGIDANALQNQTATAANMAFEATQARTYLIAKIFAETGIKDLFWLLHGIIRKHGQKAQTVMLRKQWVPVDPREWKKRDDLTVNVGLGTGSKQRQLAGLQLIINAQSQAVAAGKTNLVTDANLYASAKALTRVLGHKDVDAFFSDPSKMPPPQQPPDPKLQAIQLQAQTDAQQAQLEAKLKLQEMQQTAALDQMRFQHEQQLKEFDARLKQHEMILKAHQAHQQMHQSATEHAMDVAHAHAEHQMNLHAQAQKMELAQQAHEHKMQQQSQPKHD